MRTGVVQPSTERLIRCMEDGAAEAKSRKQNNDTARERLIHHNGRLINLQLGFSKVLISKGKWKYKHEHCGQATLWLEG